MSICKISTATAKGDKRNHGENTHIRWKKCFPRGFDRKPDCKSVMNNWTFSMKKLWINWKLRFIVKRRKSNLNKWTFINKITAYWILKTVIERLRFTVVMNRLWETWRLTQRSCRFTQEIICLAAAWGGHKLKMKLLRRTKTVVYPLS